MDNAHAGYLSHKCAVRLKHKGEFGVYAAHQIEAGEVVAEWGGEELSGEQLDRLPKRLRRYALQIDENKYLVSIHKVEKADLINHSCEPNTGLVSAIRLVALRDIGVGEEICYDYAMSDGSPYDEFTCACGSPQCRGKISGLDWKRPDLLHRYGPMFSPYLLRRINSLQPSAIAPNGFATLELRAAL